MTWREDVEVLRGMYRIAESEGWDLELILEWDEALARLDARLEGLEGAYRQACMNLATIRPDLTRDLSVGEQADLYYDALLAGWAGIEGYASGRRAATPRAEGEQ